MTKLTLSDVASLTSEQTAIATINDNWDSIVNAVEQTLYRNGAVPNQMEAELDMNSHRIINLPAAISNTEPVRLKEFSDALLAAALGEVTIETLTSFLEDFFATHSNFATVPGELNAINTTYPVGDVRRYGFYNDGFTATGTLTNGSGTITGLVGAFSQAAVGMRVYNDDITGDFGIINSVSVDGSLLTMTSTGAASGSRTVVIGTLPDNTVENAIRVNGKNPYIKLFFPAGLYVCSLNMGANWAGTTEVPWRAHFEDARFTGVLHILEGCSNVRWTGTIYTYDRFGIGAGAQIVGTLTSGSTSVTGTGGAFLNVPVGSTLSQAILTDLQEGSARVVSVAGDGNSLVMSRKATASGSRTLEVSATNIHVNNVHGLYNVLLNVGGFPLGHRGNHFVQVFDFHFNEMHIENCAATSAPGGVLTGSIAGFAFEQGASGGEIHGNKIWVKNSITHGVYINGADVYIDKIQVDGYGTSGVVFQPEGGVADSGGEDESNVATGLWFQRTSGIIGNIQVRQTNVSPSGSDGRRILFAETGRSIPSYQADKSLSIGDIYCEVGALTAGVGSGVMFGSELLTTPRMQINIQSMTVHLPLGYTMTNATDSLVSFNGGASNSKTNVFIDFLRFVHPQGYNMVNIVTGNGEIKNIRINHTNVTDYSTPGSVYKAVGHVAGFLRLILGYVNMDYSGGSYTTRALMYFELCNKLQLEEVKFIATGAGSIQVIRVQDSDFVSIRNVESQLARGTNPLGVIAFGANDYVLMDNIFLSGDDVGGSVGIYWDNAVHSYYDINHTFVKDFFVGTDKHASATFSHMSASNSASISCASASALASGDFASKVNQTLVTA